MAELWRPIPSRPTYMVSDLGGVRRAGAGFLKPQRSTKGYYKIHLGRGCQRLIHSLVLEAFVGPRPINHDVDHIDFVRTNNALTNLRYLPKLENAFRWAGREQGRNIWANAYDPPPDHVPLSEEEDHAICSELHAAGW